MIKTDRLVIRDWLPQDSPAETLAVMFQDADYSRWITDRPGAEIRADTPEKALRLLEACRSSVGANYAVVLLTAAGSEAALIGQCGIFPAAKVPERAIGFGIRPEYWGHGYGVEVALALVRHCFDHPAERVAAVTADTHQNNRAARRVLERAGMRLQRLRANRAYYRMSREEYCASPGCR